MARSPLRLRARHRLPWARVPFLLCFFRGAAAAGGASLSATAASRAFDWCACDRRSVAEIAGTFAAADLFIHAKLDPERRSTAIRRQLPLSSASVSTSDAIVVAGSPHGAQLVLDGASSTPQPASAPITAAIASLRVALAHLEAVDRDQRAAQPPSDDPSGARVLRARVAALERELALSRDARRDVDAARTLRLQLSAAEKAIKEAKERYGRVVRARQAAIAGKQAAETRCEIAERATAQLREMIGAPRAASGGLDLAAGSPVTAPARRLLERQLEALRATKSELEDQLSTWQRDRDAALAERGNLRTWRASRANRSCLLTSLLF